MSLKVLIADPVVESAEGVLKVLRDEGYEVTSVYNGKDAQLAIYKEKFFALIMDLNLKNNSCMEVIRYVKSKAPQVKLLLIAENKKALKEINLTNDEILKLGVDDILFRPLGKEKVLGTLEGDTQYEYWAQVEIKEQHSDEEEISAPDDDFTRISIKEFYSGNATIFDLYVRLSENKYVKILHRQEFFNKKRLAHYRDIKKVTHLYFKTKDRIQYVRFTNVLLERFLVKTKGNSTKAIEITKNVSEKYIEEIYVRGLKPQNIEDGKKICENVSNVVKRDKKLYKLICELEEKDSSVYTHAYLTTLFSTVICSRLNWATGATMNKVALGAMLHDIGKVKLDKRVMHLANEYQEKELSKTDLEKYRAHPEVGVELLSNFSTITTEVKQIIWQHHEHCDGSGYPRGVSNIRIYPLAKVVGMADYFANLLVFKGDSALDCLKFMLQDKDVIQKFDAVVLKALVASFVNPDRIELVA